MKNYAEHVKQLISWRRFEQGIKESEEWIKEEPEESNAYAMLAMCYFALGKYKEALSWVEAAFHYDPENVLAWYVRVGVFYEKKDETEFFKAVKEAQRIDPYEPEYHFFKFNIFHKKGNLKKAQEEISQALELNPEKSKYLAAYAYLLVRIKNYKESIACEQAALENDFENSQTFLYLAWGANERGETEKELEFLKNAIRLDPENSQIRSEYIEGLQKEYFFFRILLAPMNLLNKIKKTWVRYLVFFILWIIARPIILLFFLVYVLSYWMSRILVKGKIFGWSNIFKKMR